MTAKAKAANAINLIISFLLCSAMCLQGGLFEFPQGAFSAFLVPQIEKIMTNVLEAIVLGDGEIALWYRMSAPLIGRFGSKGDSPLPFKGGGRAMRVRRVDYKISNLDANGRLILRDGRFAASFG